MSGQTRRDVGLYLTHRLPDVERLTRVERRVVVAGVRWAYTRLHGWYQEKQQ